MERTYRIVSEHVYDDTERVVFASGLSLRDAQRKLLEFFNRNYGTSYSNWGLARINEPTMTSSSADGTRSYRFMNKEQRIEEEVDDERINDEDRICAQTSMRWSNPPLNLH